MTKLNFGCGKDIKKDYINADFTSFEGVDKNFDFNIFPYPFSDNEFEEISADNILEHLNDISSVMKELHRISRPGGEVRIIVPYYNCYGAYNDVTHKHYFSHLSFEPFYKNNSRGNYFIKEKFGLKKIKLVPTRIGRVLLFDFLRLPLSFVFGQIIQTVDITLIVKK
jgi:SAM-dependent methyltransferase